MEWQSSLSCIIGIVHEANRDMSALRHSRRVSTKDNLAYMLMKSLPRPRSPDLVERMEMREAQSQAP